MIYNEIKKEGAKMEIYERIKQRRKEIGLSAEDVAERLNVSPATIYRYEKNDIKKFPTEILKPLADVLCTTPEYLMGWTDDISASVKNLSIVNTVKKIPLIGKIACGQPILAQENWEELILLPENVSADFALRCQGNSMIDARINDGDIVYIKSQSQVDNGSIAAVLIDNEATLKRFYQQDNKVILQPENKEYQPLIYVGDEINDIRIIGKATYFLSKVE